MQLSNSINGTVVKFLQPQNIYDKSATLIVPKESELIIPVIYEYRMMDRIGKVNGENDTTINDAISYSKKIGIDLMINNELFKFDINVSSNLKSTVTPLENLNITSVVGNFDNESQENLN